VPHCGELPVPVCAAQRVYQAPNVERISQGQFNDYLSLKKAAETLTSRLNEHEHGILDVKTNIALYNHRNEVL